MGGAVSARAGLFNPAAGGGLPDLITFLNSVGAYVAWDAEAVGVFTFSGADVLTWTASISAAVATEEGSTVRPSFDATGLNGRPEVFFDGVDERLFELIGSGVLPTVAQGSEVWALVRNTAADADSVARTIFSFGGSASSVQRSVGRKAATGNTPRAFSTSTGADGPGAPATGIHVWRSLFPLGSVQMDLDEVAGTPTSVTHATSGTMRYRIGAVANSTAASFWKGGINCIAVTPVLSAPDAATLYDILQARGGI